MVARAHSCLSKMPGVESEYRFLKKLSGDDRSNADD